MLGWLHATPRLPDPSALMPFGFPYVLPVGISFFTFQSMSYTIDFYRGQVPARTQFPAFRHLRLLLPAADGRADRARPAPASAVPGIPRVQRPKRDRRAVAFPGGLVQEGRAGELPCDVRRPRSTTTRGRSARRRSCSATFAFAWQIFFDFSGYTDMARGVAKVMGFNLVLNFNNPYLATGPGRILAALAHQPLAPGFAITSTSPWAAISAASWSRIAISSSSS